MTERWTFGVEPLAQALEVAPLLRRVTNLIQALESADPAVDTGNIPQAFEIDKSVSPIIG